MLRAALMYADTLEWPVVPLHTPTPNGGCSCLNPKCESPGKHPRTIAGLKEATTNSDTIRRWWTMWPDANIGVPTGVPSGLIVIDVDGAQGETALAAYGSVPPTPTVLTGKGRHLYFAHPGVEVRNSGGRGRRKLGELLDSRGDGGYVVVPPSRHASGRVYEWDRANDLGPRDRIPQRLPDKILARLTEADPAPSDLNGGVASTADIAGLPAIVQGERNETLTSYAGRLYALGHKHPEVFELVYALNQTKCDPPLDRDQVKAIVANIGKAETNKQRRNASRALTLLSATPREPPALPDARSLAAEQIAKARAISNEDWSNAPRWRWAALDERVGPLLPGELHIVGARPGGGKTTLLLNWCDWLVTKSIPWLFIGMEMDAAQLRRQWAAWRLGLPTEHVLGNQWSRLPVGARDLVDAELEWQLSSDVASIAHFSPARRIGVLDLKQWTEWAVKEGCEVLIVDHFHRMSHDGMDGEARHAMGETVRVAKELAVKHGIRMVIAAQVNRGSRDELTPYYPPPLTALKECGTLEEEADAVLMLHRALKTGLDKKQMAAVRDGVAAIATVAEPNTMGIMVRKFRKNGAVVDQPSARLRIVDGRIEDPAREPFQRDEDRYDI